MSYPIIFEQCIKVILRHEGGYVNNPNDWGGETKYGIAKRFFPELDIKNLTIEEAKRIYFDYYWTPMNLTGIIIPENILEIFDMGVNAGRSNAIHMAQRLVGSQPDGKMGPLTTKKINSFPDFLKKYKQARVEYYMRVSMKRNNKVFLKGWLNRVSTTYF